MYLLYINIQSEHFGSIFKKSSRMIKSEIWQSLYREKGQKANYIHTATVKIIDCCQTALKSWNYRQIILKCCHLIILTS